MDELTAGAGLTRGALYYHFGDKKGLVQAVIQQIDGEMTARLHKVSATHRAGGRPSSTNASCRNGGGTGDPTHPVCDSTAVLGDISQWPSTNGCIQALADALRQLQADSAISADIDIEVTARLINGASAHAALWIANSDDPQATSKRAVGGFRTLLERLKT